MSFNAIRYGYYYRGPGYSAELQAVLDQADSSGYTKPSASSLSAWDTFLVAREADGSMAKMDVLYNFAWNDSAVQNFASLNHITPASNQAVYTNTPTYGVNGIKGNGSTSYVETYNPATAGVNYIQDSASRGMYVMTAPTVGTALDGIAGSGNNRMMYENVSSHRINQGGNNLNAIVDFTGVGYKAINRSDASTVQCYIGTTKLDRGRASVAIDSAKQLIGRALTLYSNTEFGLYYMGGSLTETQHNNIANDYATFLAAIGL